MSVGVDRICIKPDAKGRHWCYGRHEYLIKEEPGAEQAVRLKTNRRWQDENK